MTPPDATPPGATLAELRGALAGRLSEQADGWLTRTEAGVAGDRTALRDAFPAVGRRLGRGPLRPERAHGDARDLHAWTVDDAGRSLLLAAQRPTRGEDLTALYRGGDAAERRGVLRALDVIELDGAGREAGAELVADALRTNDLRLVAAALGPFGLGALDDDALAHAVLKCVFSGVPLTGIAGLHARATPQLARMLAAYAHERVAAGRSVPAEIWPLVDAHPPAAELDALAAELDAPVAARRDAARAALHDRHHARSPAREDA